MNWSDLTQDINTTLEDGTHVIADIIFLALDRPQDVRKLRSLQLTGAWLNEVKELPFEVITMVFARCGRYPRRGEVEPYWYGIVGDTNACDEDHWYYRLAEEERPEGWIFIRQPPAVIKDGENWLTNEQADNIHNLPIDYYKNQIAGNKTDWIKVNLANEYGFVMDGKPVHPEYVDSVHCSPDIIKPIKGLEIVLGFDFGRTPACAFFQQTSMGRWVGLDEFTSNGMSAATFAPELKLYIDKNYGDFKFKIGWGDPAGDKAGEATDDTPFKILRKHGLLARPTSTNAPLQRRASLANPMLRNCMDGKPAFIISPKCRMLRKGLAGGFCYKRVQVSGERYHNEPDKNEYSHIVEAAEYALQGEGEGRDAIIGESQFTQPVIAPVDFNVFG